MACILIYSEEGLWATLIETILSEQGIELAVARNPEQLRCMTASRSYEVVIIVGVGLLYRGEGWVQRLRSNRLHPPEIYLLAWQHGEQTVLGMLECGVDQYMTLPLHPARLRAKVMQALAE